MKDRISEFLKAENKSSAQFAEEIGVQPSGISHILSGRNNPSLDFILKMLGKYTFLSTDWLLFGKGNMYRETIQSASLFDFPANETGKSDKTAFKEPDRKVPPEIEKETERKVADKYTLMAKNPHAERIVIFFKDLSYREYFPDDK